MRVYRQVGMRGLCVQACKRASVRACVHACVRAYLFVEASGEIHGHGCNRVDVDMQHDCEAAAAPAVAGEILGAGECLEEIFCWRF